MRRLGKAPKVASDREALRLLRDTLDAVEDELTEIAHNPRAWETDGRLYPPQDDSERDVPGHPSVRCFRSVDHHTFVGANGSIEIAPADAGVPPRKVIFRKPGADGRTVWKQKKG